jgi:hypothetical protein
VDRKAKMMAALNHLTPLDVFNGKINDPTRVRNIQGRPVIVDFKIDQIEFESLSLSDDGIKLKLCNDIAIELYKKNMIEFTKQQNHETGVTHFRARIFAVPNSDVQLLREQEII